MATIIIKNSATPSQTPSSLTQGELAINVTDGKLYYGSGSSNIVKEFTGTGGSTNTGSLLTTASVSSNTITFTKGDGSTFPITVSTGSNVINRSPVYTYLNTTVLASNTRYTAVSYGTTSGTEVTTVIPYSSTYKNMYVRTSSAQPASGALTITLRKNTADTSITITIAAGSAAGTFSDTANSVSYSAGDLISLKYVNAATAASCNMYSISLLSEI